MSHRLLITGSRGFIGKNLLAHLTESSDFVVATFDRGDDLDDLPSRISMTDTVIHLAGANRPEQGQDFDRDNVDLTRRLVAACDAAGRAPTIVVASSVQAELDNPYGRSKLAAEHIVTDYAAATGAVAHIMRLPNVFGKWCRPNYNSVFATFCHNIAHDLPIVCHDPSALVRAVYVDDVCASIMAVLRAPSPGGWLRIEPEYEVNVGKIAESITAFHQGRNALRIEHVGAGFLRALYATYLSYLPPTAFTYPLPAYGDARGTFVEMLKTRDSGQMSFFSARPGVTRGGHYHHTKTEKFLVIKGRARFRFRNIATDEHHELEVDDGRLKIVDTVPGWSHDITNVGEDELLVMLWASEIFDRDKPDTYSRPLA